MQLEWKLAVQSFPNAPRGGDAGVFRPTENGAIVALIDATGHGLSAYSVAQKARNIVLKTSNSTPDAILEELHEGLKGTIGAAASIACINGEKLSFAGTGNVNAFVGTKHMTLRAGVIGQRMREQKITDVDFPPNVWLLMHTDGVSDVKNMPHGSAETVANSLIDSYGTDHDDSAVMLVRWRDQIG